MGYLTKVDVGDIAPDFTLPSQKGDAVTLSSFRGKKSVVLYFYPKDGSPGCTRQACSFRDSYGVFKELGAEVVGVSSDDVGSHERFAAENALEFILLSDRDGRVRRMYGATSGLGLLPGRVTYVIDKEGVVRHVFSSQLQPEKHIEEAIRVLKEIEGS